MQIIFLDSPSIHIHFEDHNLAGLIGICVLIICVISFIGMVISYGIKNPTSMTGQMIQACNFCKLFPKINNNITASQVNLVTEEHSNSTNETSV